MFISTTGLVIMAIAWFAALVKDAKLEMRIQQLEAQLDEGSN